MKKLILLPLLILFVGCIGHSTLKEDTLEVTEVRMSKVDGYKYFVALSTSQGWTSIHTNTSYEVGEKVQLIQKVK